MVISNTSKYTFEQSKFYLPTKQPIPFHPRTKARNEALSHVYTVKRQRTIKSIPGAPCNDTHIRYADSVFPPLARALVRFRRGAHYRETSSGSGSMYNTRTLYTEPGARRRGPHCSVASRISGVLECLRKASERRIRVLSEIWPIS